MPESLIIALVRIGVQLGVNIIALLRANGYEPTAEEMTALRKASQDEVDRFNRLVGD